MSDATAKAKLITERRAIRAWILRDSLHSGGIGRGGAYQSGDRRTGKTLMKVLEEFIEYWQIKRDLTRRGIVEVRR